MTLDSRVFIDSPHINAKSVLDQMQLLLCKYDEGDRSPASIKTKTWDDSIGNEPMQNLPAWVIVYHNGERPIREDANACHEYCEKDDSYHYHKPAHWLKVSMDTTYGYRGPDGMGCGDLHAAMIAELGQWLDSKGAAWSWENEFTSEIHGGPDRYDRLVDLMTGGFEATAWFKTSALPAIISSIAGEQS